MGVHAGRIILCHQYTNERIKRWFAWTIILVCITLFLITSQMILGVYYNMFKIN